jgi:recombination protein RecT
MAYKTMLRQILSKWGNLNFEMQQALESDMAIIEEDGSKTYIDNIVENSNYNNTEEQNNNMQMESRSIDQNQNLTIEQNYKSAFDALFN